MRLLSHLLWWLSIATLLEDVSHLLTRGWRSVEELVTHIWHAIRALFLKLRDVFGHLWDAFADFYKSVVALGHSLIHFARNVVHGIGWLVETAIPAVGRWALREAVKLAKSLVATLRKWVVKTVAWLRKHLERLIDFVERLARHFYRTLLKSLRAAWHWITKAGHRLYDLVMHPRKLVAWILPHLIMPLLKFFLAGPQVVIEYLLRRLLTVALKLATVIEAEVARIL